MTNTQQRQIPKTAINEIFIHEDILAEEDLQPSDKLLFGYLRELIAEADTDYTKTSKSALAKLTNIGERTVYACLERLETFGYIEISGREKSIGKKQLNDVGFIPIPAPALHDKKLNPSDKLLYGVIANLINASDKEFVRMENSELGEMIGLKKDNVSKLISRLKQQKYIAVVQIDSWKGKNALGDRISNTRWIYLDKDKAQRHEKAIKRGRKSIEPEFIKYVCRGGMTVKAYVEYRKREARREYREKRDARRKERITELSRDEFVTDEILAQYEIWYEMEAGSLKKMHDECMGRLATMDYSNDDGLFDD